MQPISRRTMIVGASAAAAALALPAVVMPAVARKAAPARWAGFPLLVTARSATEDGEIPIGRAVHFGNYRTLPSTEYFPALRIYLTYVGGVGHSFNASLLAFYDRWQDENYYEVRSGVRWPVGRLSPFNVHLRAGSDCWTWKPDAENARWLGGLQRSRIHNFDLSGDEVVNESVREVEYVTLRGGRIALNLIQCNTIANFPQAV